MNKSDLDAIDAHAKLVLKQLKQRYAKLDAYLVYSSRLGQAPIEASVKQLLIKFPKIFLDGIEKTSAMKQLGIIIDLEKRKADCTEESRLLEQSGRNLEVDSTVTIALRFEELDYETIWQLKTDPLVDQNLTSEHRSSINVVLGSLRDLSRRV